MTNSAEKKCLRIFHTLDNFPGGENRQLDDSLCSGQFTNRMNGKVWHGHAKMVPSH